MILKEYILHWQEVYDKNQSAPPPTPPMGISSRTISFPGWARSRWRS